MQKSFLIVVIISALGALAIDQLTGELYAAITFLSGAIIAVIVFAFLCRSTLKEQASSPSLTLYVGNLPYRVHEGEVKALFSQYGEVNSVRLVRDRKTGRRKGFGFVEMSQDDAYKAMDTLNDQIFHERTLKVREAKTQDAPIANEN